MGKYPKGKSEMLLYSKISLFLLCLVFSSGKLFAQDILIGDNGVDSLICLVNRITPKKVYYLVREGNQSIQKHINRRYLRLIRFGNGKIFLFPPKPLPDTISVNYPMQRSWLISIEPVPIFFEQIKVHVEKTLLPGVSGKFLGNFMGIGIQTGFVNLVSGFEGAIGLKYTFQKKKQKKYHPHQLNGFFVQAQYFQSKFVVEDQWSDISFPPPGTPFNSVKRQVQGKAVLISLGWQTILWDRFALAATYGVGSGIKKQAIIEMTGPLLTKPRYSNIFDEVGFFGGGDNKWGHADQFLLSIGVLIGKKQKVINKRFFLFPPESTKVHPLHSR